MNNWRVINEREIMQRTLLVFLGLMAVVFCFATTAQADIVTVAKVDASNTNFITSSQGSNVKETITNIDLFLTGVTLGDFTPKKDGSAEFKMTWVFSIRRVLRGSTINSP